MNINHFTGVAILIISLATGSLIAAAITGAVAWSQATPIIVILVGVISKAIERR